MMGFYKINNGNHVGSFAFVIAPVLSRMPSYYMDSDAKHSESVIAPTYWTIVANVRGFTCIATAHLTKVTDFNSDRMPQIEAHIKDTLSVSHFQKESKVKTISGTDLEPIIRAHLYDMQVAEASYKSIFTPEKPVAPAVTKETSPNRHPHADAIHAWAEGASIICKPRDAKNWCVASHPNWDIETEYKVAYAADFMVVNVAGRPHLMQVAEDVEDVEILMAKPQALQSLLFVKQTQAIFQKISQTGEINIDWIKMPTKGFLINVPPVQLFLDDESNLYVTI